MKNEDVRMSLGMFLCNVARAAFILNLFNYTSQEQSDHQSACLKMHAGHLIAFLLPT